MDLHPVSVRVSWHDSGLSPSRKRISELIKKHFLLTFSLRGEHVVL